MRLKRRTPRLLDRAEAIRKESERMVKEYLTVKEIVGPLTLREGVEGAKYNELVEVEFPDGSIGLGNVLEVEEDLVLLQSFESTSGLNVTGTRVRFTGKGLELPVTTDLLGRVFAGLGRAIDKG